MRSTALKAICFLHISVELQISRDIYSFIADLDPSDLILVKYRFIRWSEYVNYICLANSGDYCFVLLTCRCLHHQHRKMYSFIPRGHALSTLSQRNIQTNEVTLQCNIIYSFSADFPHIGRFHFLCYKGFWNTLITERRSMLITGETAHNSRTAKYFCLAGLSPHSVGDTLDWLTQRSI